jgi:hypothetical protein
MATSPAGRVAASVELTVREGTARIWHCSRVGGPTGPAAAMGNEEGEADLSQRRALCEVTRRVGVRNDAEVVGRELVRGVATEHVRAWVDVAKVASCSPERLSFPRRPAEAFPAEVWLDELGRIRRMSCSWPHKRRRWWWKRFGPPRWMTTELWEFGAPAEIPPVDGADWTRRE